MERVVLQWNLENWITVTIMATLGGFLVLGLASLMSKGRPPKANT